MRIESDCPQRERRIMERSNMLQNRRGSFVSAASGVLPLLIGLVLVSPIDGFSASSGQGARPLREKEAVMFPHMDAALGLLETAQGQLEKGEPIFYGHRVIAIQHVKRAIANLQLATSGRACRAPSGYCSRLRYTSMRRRKYTTESGWRDSMKRELRSRKFRQV
jgi:hypothetical protein